jgi:hypothetical protein
MQFAIGVTVLELTFVKHSHDPLGVKLVGWLNSEAIFHAYMPPIESVVAISSMLMWHYWSPYLSKREVCFGRSTNWFRTLLAQAWEDFICPNHDPDPNRPFYLKRRHIFWSSIREMGTMSDRLCQISLISSKIEGHCPLKFGNGWLVEPKFLALVWT